MNSDTTGQRTIVTLIPSQESGLQMLAGSPDGTRILTSRPTGQGGFRLRWMNTTSGEMTAFFEGTSQGDFDAEISPDGRYVAIGGVLRRGKREILLVASDGASKVGLYH